MKEQLLNQQLDISYYLLEEGNKPRFRYYQYKGWHETPFLCCLDILRQDDELHVLITTPSCAHGGIMNVIEYFATHVYTDLYIAKRVNNPAKVHWYTLYLPNERHHVLDMALDKIVMQWNETGFVEPKFSRVSENNPFDLTALKQVRSKEEADTD